MTFTHLDWTTVEDACYKLSNKMFDDIYKPTCIIGLMKGGIVPARIFADHFHISSTFYALNVSLYTGINETKDIVTIDKFPYSLDDKNVLIVDDIWDSGRTMTAVVDYLKLNNKNTDIKTVTLYYKDGSVNKPDYHMYIALKNEWIVFPWEKFDFITERCKLKENKEI